MNLPIINQQRRPVCADSKGRTLRLPKTKQTADCGCDSLHPPKNLTYQSSKQRPAHSCYSSSCVDVGEKREESKLKPATPEAKCLKQYREMNDDYAACSPLKGLSDSSNRHEYQVVYAVVSWIPPNISNSGKQPRHFMPVVFFKHIPHTRIVAQQKIIAQNLGMSVHTRTEKIIAANKYAPKISEEKRREIEMYNRTQAAKAKLKNPGAVTGRLTSSKPEIQSLVYSHKDTSSGNDAGNLQPADGKEKSNS